MVWTVGLTGGIGSGKSAVADRFAARGVLVVDTDAIARDLTGPDGAAMPALRRTFGPDVAAPDGSLDRPRMRALAFRDESARKRLEAILHPLVRQESESRLKGAQSAYAILVVPLLVETGADPERYQRILVVDCPESLQIDRVGRRSGLSEMEIRRILAAQADRGARLAVADDVIENAGPIDALDSQVELLHRRYLAMAQAARPSSP